MYLLDPKPMRCLRGFTVARVAVRLVIHANFSDRMALRWRRFIQVSALSTVDGRVLAYHGCNG